MSPTSFTPGMSAVKFRQHKSTGPPAVPSPIVVTLYGLGWQATRSSMIMIARTSSGPASMPSRAS